MNSVCHASSQSAVKCVRCSGRAFTPRSCCSECKRNRVRPNAFTQLLTPALVQVASAFGRYAVNCVNAKSTSSGQRARTARNVRLWTQIKNKHYEYDALTFVNILEVFTLSTVSIGYTATAFYVTISYCTP